MDNNLTVLDKPIMAREIYELNKSKSKDNAVMFILRPTQLNILGQVFRPIFTGNIQQITDQFVVLNKVNIKMSNSPEFIFPTSLVIPLNQIVTFFEFNPNERFPLF